MAWGARSGLKRRKSSCCALTQDGLNGLGSPFGIETRCIQWRRIERNQGLNGLGSPFGIETPGLRILSLMNLWLNGLGSPFGIETVERVQDVQGALKG